MGALVTSFFAMYPGLAASTNRLCKATEMKNKIRCIQSENTCCGLSLSLCFAPCTVLAYTLVNTPFPFEDWFKLWYSPIYEARRSKLMSVYSPWHSIPLDVDV